VILGRPHVSIRSIPRKGNRDFWNDSASPTGRAEPKKE
jgi:hypothetical protein